MDKILKERESFRSVRERFYAGATYVGLDGTSNSVAHRSDLPRCPVMSEFSYEVPFQLYAAYQQATIGPYDEIKPPTDNFVELIKQNCWKGLGDMHRLEAMRLFVSILEENDSTWYSKVPCVTPEPVADVEKNLRGITVYDQWVAPPVCGPCPRARYKHGAAVVNHKMYVFGGNSNGSYLSDLQTLDLSTWTWSKVEVRAGIDCSPTPCAGHSLIAWEGIYLFSIGGHMEVPLGFMQVKVFDRRTSRWYTLTTYGKLPVSRGGHSATLLGSKLVIFGGEDAKQSPLSDLQILDLETMVWNEIDTLGVAPSPRSDHAAAVHAERYFFIFGGVSHGTCLNDLHVLDLQTMEWSSPVQQGEIPGARAGHAGVAIGDNWFVVGGGNNQCGVSQTVVLNMSTIVWSVVTTVQRRAPLASEGLSLVLSSQNSEEDTLVSFGGYNGQYSKEVNVLKLRNKSRKIISGSKLLPLQLKLELAEAKTRRAELYEELRSVREKLINEESSNFELEQRLQTIQTLTEEPKIQLSQLASSELSMRR